MDNQHKLIKGYRDLTPVEIELMNQIKAKGEELEALLIETAKHLAHQRQYAPSAEEHQRLADAEPLEWLQEGRRDLQVGLMKITRAIAQPGTF